MGQVIFSLLNLETGTGSCPKCCLSLTDRPVTYPPFQPVHGLPNILLWLPMTSNVINVVDFCNPKITLHKLCRFTSIYYTLLAVQSHSCACFFDWSLRPICSAYTAIWPITCPLPGHAFSRWEKVEHHITLLVITLTQPLPSRATYNSIFVPYLNVVAKVTLYP